VEYDTPREFSDTFLDREYDMGTFDPWSARDLLGLMLTPSALDPARPLEYQDGLADYGLSPTRMRTILGGRGIDEGKFAMFLEEARSEVIAPTLAALAADGALFRGLLYAGLMNTAEGLRVVEFNCRFGDPETQAILPLLDSPILDLLTTVAEGGSLAGRRQR